MKGVQPVPVSKAQLQQQYNWGARLRLGDQQTGKYPYRVFNPSGEIVVPGGLIILYPANTPHETQATDHRARLAGYLGKELGTQDFAGLNIQLIA